MGKRKYNSENVPKIIESYGGTWLDKVYKNSKQQLNIRCNCGKEFKRSMEKINSRKSATCKICSSKRGASDRVMDLKQIKEQIEKLGGKLISENYINARTPIKLECPICEKEFEREWQIIKRDKTIICKSCSCVKSNEDNKVNLEEIKKIVEELGSTLLSKKYSNRNENLRIKCGCGRVLNRNYATILGKQNVRCRVCTKDISNGEYKILKLLEKNKIEFIMEHIFEDCRSIRPLKFDFFIPKLNTCIEYDGEFHYIINKRMGGVDNLISIKIRDTIKNVYCRRNDINLIRIPYWNYKKIETILIENKIIPSQAYEETLGRCND